MRQYLCSIALGDDRNHVVTNKTVTIAEIAVLRAVHGAPAVSDIRPPPKPNDKLLDEEGKPIDLRNIDRTDSEERERLRMIYDAATPDQEPVVERLFGAMGPLPQSLRDIGIDPAAAADELRRQAEAMSAAATQLADEDDALPAEDEDSFFDDVDAGSKAAVKKVA